MSGRPAHPATSSALADTPAHGLRAAWNRAADLLSRLVSHDLLALASRLSIAAIFFLSGRTKDANLNYLAVELNSIGVRLMEARVVADVPEAIIKAVERSAGLEGNP